MQNFKSDIQLSRFVWALVVVIFVTDLLLPPSVEIVFAYLLAHFLAIYFKEKSDVLLLAVITTALTVAGAVLKPHEVLLEQMLVKRIAPIISFGAAAFFVMRFIALRVAESEQGEKFRALFYFSTNGILLTDQSGNIVMANPAVEKLFGYAEREIIGQKVEVLIPQRFLEKHKQHRERYHQAPQSRSMGIGLDLYGMRKDGFEFSIEVSLSPFHSTAGVFVIAFLVDNTYRKKYESSILEQKQALAKLSTELKELNESLEKKVAERTAELEQARNELSSALNKERELGELKSRFVSMASHEFRTPLTSVLSSASLAGQYAEQGDFAKVKKHTERIKNAVNGLNSILSEFLSLGRLEEGYVSVQWSKNDLNECVAEVYEGMKDIFKPGQTLEHRHVGPSEAVLDCSLIKNILINLISNAIKYSPEGAPIQVESFQDSEKVCIKVKDQGMGIPEDEQKHLFERFFRASNAANTTQGTGLGLYIVQRYVGMMGGQLFFESAIGRGSSFWVEIPVKKQP